MKKHFVLGIFSVTTLLTGCITPPSEFVPKPLNDNAKGIATVRETPYGCKVLGEMEGFEGKHEYERTPTLAQVREGAMNDLRNRAFDVVESSKRRIVLKVIGSSVLCFGGQACPEHMYDDDYVNSYRVSAQVFECGDK